VKKPGSADLWRFMTGMRDPRDYSFWWRYDWAGRCIEGAGKDGLWWGRLEYDRDRRQTKVTERQGGVWAFRYDDSDTLVEIEDPYGGKLQREVDDEGKVVREIDSGGRELQWLYDSTGIHTGRRDDLGYEYPPEEQMPKLPDPLAPQAPTTAYEWCVGEREEEPVEPWRLSKQRPRETAHSLAAFLPPEAQAAADDVIRPPSPGDKPKPERRYDDLGHLVEEVDPFGRRRLWRYDPAGNEVWHSDADGKSHQKETHSWNLVGTEIDPSGHRTSYSYTSTEQVSAIIDPKGTTSEYDYDEKDRLIRVRRHGVTKEEYEYDQGDRLVEKRDSQGNVLLQLTYDERSLVKRRILTDGGVQMFFHAPGGEPTEASTNRHQVLIGRDLRGRVRSDKVDGLGLERTGTDALEVTTYFDRFKVSVTGDTRGTVSLVDPTGAEHILRTSPDGLTLRQHAGGTTELCQYDDQGKREGVVLCRQFHRGVRRGIRQVRAIRYQYTAQGDLVGVFDSDRGLTRYDVDSAHRLIKEDGPDGTFAFEHDEAGNLVSKPGLALAVTDQNRLTWANGQEYLFNDRNHLAESRPARGTREWLDRRRPGGLNVRYFYDSLDMLVRVEDEHGEPWTAEYDGLGRRLSCGRCKQQTRFFWDGERLAAEIAPQGYVRLYLYPDHEARVPWLIVDSESFDSFPESAWVYSVFTNQVGMPVLVEDQLGQEVWQAKRVDPYGAVEVELGAEIDLNLRWPGHYYDADTGLHYNRFRYYDPQLGRYLQCDPVGQSGGVNLYAYAPNPVVFVDLLGLAHKKRGKANKAKNGTNAETPRDPNAKAGGAVSNKGGNATDMPVIAPRTPAWKDAVKDLKKPGKSKNYRVKSQADAEALLREGRGDVPKFDTYTGEAYKKGYEVHPNESHTINAPENDLPHVKWKDWSGGKGDGASGHIFFGEST
jgi:RHS repeat-associated protein